jgi:hypothetical protein
MACHTAGRLLARLTLAARAVLSVFVFVFWLHRTMMPKLFEAAIMLCIVSFDKGVERV